MRSAFLLRNGYELWPIYTKQVFFKTRKKDNKKE